MKDRPRILFQEPWVKNVFAWWNKCYNEGLLDPELFVKKQDQLNEEAVRGRFAVMNMNPWHGWTTNARQYAKENKLKYGYRVIMAWWPRSLKATYYDSSNRWTSYSSHSGNVITKNVKEEDLAQVCNWLDYHYSEEFDILASWGPSTFYTGTGAARRFLPAYKDLENFQAYGIAKPERQGRLLLQRDARSGRRHRGRRVDPRGLDRAADRLPVRPAVRVPGQEADRPGLRHHHGQRRGASTTSRRRSTTSRRSGGPDPTWQDPSTRGSSTCGSARTVPPSRR